MGEQIVKPIFESKNDLEIIYLIAKKFGFADKMFKNIQVDNNLPQAEDVLREMNRGSWSTAIAASRRSASSCTWPTRRLDLVTMRAKDGPCKGDYYGLPGRAGASRRSASGHAPSLQHNLNVMDGGGTFRAPFRRRARRREPARRRLLLARLGDNGWLSEFTMAVLKKLGWDKDLSAEELATIEKIAGSPEKTDTVSWSTDLSGASSASR